MALRARLLLVAFVAQCAYVAATPSTHKALVNPLICPAYCSVTVITTVSVTAPCFSLQTTNSSTSAIVTAPSYNVTTSLGNSIAFINATQSLLALSLNSSVFQTISFSPTNSSGFSILSVAPTTTFSPSSVTVSAYITVVTTGICHQDNCLRQFLQNPTVLDFCATYTTTSNTATTSLPTYVSMCRVQPALPIDPLDPTAISSACSCVTGMPPPPVTSAAPSTTGVASPVGSSIITGSFSNITTTPLFANSTISTSLSSISSTSSVSTCPSPAVVFQTVTEHTTFLVTATYNSTFSATSTSV